MVDSPSQPATDARWPKILSLAAHELRSPLSVAAGYVRMLLQQRAGPLSEGQQRLLEEAEKSCGRLSALLLELSDLAKLESGTAAFNRSTVSLERVLAEAIAALPPLPERDLRVRLDESPTRSVPGDATRLRSAFAAIFHALSRELVPAEDLVVRVAGSHEVGPSTVRVGMAGPSKIEVLMQLPIESFAPFDEWRGGTGLSLPTARRIIEAHGGRLLSPPDDSKASAAVFLPSIP